MPRDEELRFWHCSITPNLKTQGRLEVESRSRIKTAGHQKDEIEASVNQKQVGNTAEACHKCVRNIYEACGV